jgi:FHS family L-fucose permease-like MFS transporter
MELASAPATRAGDSAVKYSKNLQVFVFALFFTFGGITSLNDVIIPKLKELFKLNYADVMMVQFAFFAAYFIFSIPAAELVRKIGYMRSAVAGLLIMTTGCLLFVPASANSLFPLFLLALFVLAAGITTVQVVANPLISMLGKPATASSRLTFAQAFNSLGTTIFPYVGSGIILVSISKIDPSTLSGAALASYRATESHVIASAYVGLAIALGILALVVWLYRKQLVEIAPTRTPILRAFNLLKQPRFAFGTLCIFLYVGGEVAIGSVIGNYLQLSSTLALAQKDAGEHISYYWGGAMVGRFIGSLVLRFYSPGKVLAAVALAVIALLTVSANTVGFLSGWSLLGIGFFNSIMFPTIFTLANEGLGPRAAEGSGVICMAIVGGAIVPLVMGAAADTMGLKAALLVPAACYLGIMMFGWFARRPLAAA